VNLEGEHPFAGICIYKLEYSGSMGIKGIMHVIRNVLFFLQKEINTRIPNF